MDDHEPMQAVTAPPHVGLARERAAEMLPLGAHLRQLYEDTNFPELNAWAAMAHEQAAARVALELCIWSNESQGLG